MRKSNWLVATLAVVASAALLWAWFALGFNHVDDPLDLIVAILWWVVVAAVVGAILWAARRCAWPSWARALSTTRNLAW
jgi:lipopolysaccharide export LptBFGC system permease protein LptF